MYTKEGSSTDANEDHAHNIKTNTIIAWNKKYHQPTKKKHVKSHIFSSEELTQNNSVFLKMEWY